MPIMSYDALTQNRFWERVAKSEDGCWVWTGSVDGSGYGHVWVRGAEGKRTHPSVHRLSYEMHYGPIPAGLFVCHHCDNPPCVRPDHLFLGTNGDNVRDMRRKGRHRDVRMAGSAHGQSKLTESQVVEMRTLYASGQRLIPEIAEMFCISRSNASRIVRGKVWRHVTIEEVEPATVAAVTG